MDKNRLRDAARNNIVTIMFIVLCAVCMAFSGYAPNYVLYELFGRLSRNMFIVLSLIIPIVAGMGINFAITIGAMAAQIACLLVLEWGVSGIGGLALAALLTVPLGGVFGFLIGKLLNRMKGQEMIGSMILGYFANGLYQLLFLFIFDNIIPIHNPNLTIKGSTGIANTMDLSREGGFAYSLEKLWQLPASQAALVFAAVAAVLLVAGYLVSHRRNAKKLAVQLGVIAAGGTQEQLDAADRYAEALGLAFQTRDDMLDVLGDAGKMGKATGMDENKNTFVRLYGVGACSRLIEKETQKSIEALGVFEDSEFLKELSMKLAIREC